ncbi:MAG TPA: membrane dipeptidase, partial [Nitriliruptorales bacterium]
CTEPADAGISRFGRRLVGALNKAGIVVDGSHTGERTTLEAMEVSDAPFVFTHSGCRAVYDHVRNLTDTQIRECAQTGGVVGVLGLPYFIGPAEEPTIEQIVAHAAHVAELVGIDHVGIGMDYWHGVTPYMSDEQQLRLREQENHTWRPGDIPVGAWSYAPGIQTPAGMRNLTAAFLRHGFTYAETRQIVGENFLRVFGHVWAT